MNHPLNFWGITHFKHEAVKRFLDSGDAVDGTKGGLLIGRSHEEGGIPILMRYNDAYKVVAEIEGQEYIFNAAASAHFRERLKILNNPSYDGQWTTIGETIPDHVTKIDCTINPNTYSQFETKYLVLDGRHTYFVINKYSTWRHMELLDQLNKSILGACPNMLLLKLMKYPSPLIACTVSYI
ncbi:hypothetical protein [Pontibacter sp. SGAir0037]|uniref:hypothetical protein n=1 Tax=Pontibacter sp. SGAir0037 TaxID=2571030 RepID=UPI0010CCF0C1|nr:hypothetical protein [Pontibacter sp. SGAir0037]QCR23765.1 hypothetical protein C1N53_16365 [Pontibacter sp. SGAir0037]